MNIAITALSKALPTDVALLNTPVSIFSILGIKGAVKLRKRGEKNMGLLILIGTVNIFVSFVVAAFWLYVFFIGGAGV
jgi:hypothetical protein